MADLVIRGMEMPKERNLWFCIKTDGAVYDIGTAHAIGTAVPLPEGHGRLIDADALTSDFVKARWEFFSDGDTFLRLLKHAPIIISAEGGTENAP